MAETLFTNSKVEGLVSPEDLVQAELITIFGNTDQTIQFDFKTNTSAPATLGNTTRVDYCRKLPIEKPMVIDTAMFRCFDGLCNSEDLIVKTIGDGIEKIENSDIPPKTIGLKIKLEPEDTENLPDEVGFSLMISSAEFGQKIYSFGSLQIRYFPISQ